MQKDQKLNIIIILQQQNDKMYQSFIVQDLIEYSYSIPVDWIRILN